MSTECICKTFECKTQFMWIPYSTYLCKCHCSANSAANIFCWGEADSKDTIFSDTPAVNGGQTSTQIFDNCHKKLVFIHPLNDTGEDEIFGALKDRVCWHGAPGELTSDNALVYTSSKFMKYVCYL